MEKERSRKHHKNPSFSTTLLDEIYRSIDGYDQIRQDLKLPKPISKHYSSTNGAANKPKVEDEEIARARYIEKWMEKKVKDKVLMNRSKLADELDNDVLVFFSSGSSSDYSSSGTLSEADSFYSEKSSRTTCFSKSVRTRAGGDEEMYTDYRNEEGLIKSKSRALKIYNNLKKMKQPISPGGRLTSFLTSIFNNGNGKKSKNPSVVERSSKSTTQASSTCSSASSFSRSCFSKNPTPKFSEKFQNGVKRTVRFNPVVGVIVDQDSHHKCIVDKGSRKFEETKSELKKKNDFIEDFQDDDYDDASSDSSSDLFEIDHLASFGNQELPVYETTNLDTIRGIPSAFIR